MAEVGTVGNAEDLLRPRPCQSVPDIISGGGPTASRDHAVVRALINERLGL